MQIIFLSPHSDPQAKLGEPDAGGQCVYENELAHEMAANGHHVYTFCRQRNSHPAVSEVETGYTIFRITSGGSGFIPKEEIAPTIPDFVRQTAAILKKNIDDRTPAIIHSHYWDGALAALMLKSNYRDLPMVWTPHSLGFCKRDKYKGISYESIHHFIPRLTWENYASAISDKIICSTKDEKRKLLRYYHCLPGRIHVIPPGVGIGSEASADHYLTRWQLTKDVKILLCLGRMARTKGYQHAIRILRELEQKEPGKFALVVVGGGSNLASEEEAQYQKELRRLTVKFGLQGKVIFQPSVPHHEIQAIYSLADFYLMTAEEEPFGLTVIEAMASGCVVISHDRGGSRSMLKNGLTGFVTDMHKYASVASLIAQLSRRPRKMEGVGERAKAVVMEKYSWKSRLPQFLKVYEELISPPASRLNKLKTRDYFYRRNTNIL